MWLNLSHPIGKILMRSACTRLVPFSIYKQNGRSKFKFCGSKCGELSYNLIDLRGKRRISLLKFVTETMSVLAGFNIVTVSTLVNNRLLDYSS